MSKQVYIENIKMPAGTYYIGDLYYVMHSEWDEFCDHEDEGYLQLKDGRDCCWFYTKYGDGVYMDQFANQYGVDTGLIGCIKVENINVTNDENNINLGHVFTFDNDFYCYKEDGRLVFGHVVIDTSEEESDEYYDSLNDMDDDIDLD